jgi:hypothetical protein
MTDGELGIERRLSMAGLWRKYVDGAEADEYRCNAHQQLKSMLSLS